MQYFLSCEAVLPLIFKQNLLFIIPPIVKKSKYLLIKQKANLSNARSAFSLRNYILECNIFCNLMQLFIIRLLHRQCFLNIEVYDVAALHANNAVANSLFQKFYCIVSHLGCCNTVANCRRAAALYMSQNSGTGFNTGLFLEQLGNFFCKSSLPFSKVIPSP